jgi:hypothetical protein
MSDAESHAELESSSDSDEVFDSRTIHWRSPEGALVEHLQPVAHMDHLVAVAAGRNADFLRDCVRIEEHYTHLQVRAHEYRSMYPSGPVKGSQETAARLAKLVKSKHGSWLKRINKIDKIRTTHFYPLWNNRHAAGRVEAFVEEIESFNNDVTRAIDNDNLELADLY